MKQNSIAINSLYNVLLKVFQLVVPILVGPYLAYILDVELYGIYNTALSQIDFFMIFAAFGVNVYGLREISKVRNNKNRKNEIFTSLFIISTVSCFISFIIFLIYVYYYVDISSSTVYYILSFKIVLNIFMVEWVNEATENYRFITVKTIIVRLVNIVGLFIFVRKPEDIINYSLLVIITTFINNILSYVYIKKEFKFTVKNISIKRHIYPLVSILVISNINLFYTQFDKLLLGFFDSKVAVSFYYLPQNIMSIITTVLTAIVMVTIARLAFYNSNNMEKEYNHLLVKTYRNFMLIVFPTCIGVACLSKEIMYLYGSDKYIGAYIVLMIFAIRTITSSLYTVYANQVLYIKGKEKILLRYLIIGAIINVVFNGILIYLDCFSPETAIMTTFIAEIILNIFLNRYIKKNIGLKINLFDKYTKRYLLLSLIFIPISAIIKILNFSYLINVILIVTICVLVYFGGLYLLNDKVLLDIYSKVKKKIKV